MDSSRITYTSRPDATPEAEVKVLANVYRFILDCHAKKKAAESHSCNDATNLNSAPRLVDVGHAQELIREVEC